MKLNNIQLVGFGGFILFMGFCLGNIFQILTKDYGLLDNPVFAWIFKISFILFIFGCLGCAHYHKAVRK